MNSHSYGTWNTGRDYRSLETSSGEQNECMIFHYKDFDDCYADYERVQVKILPVNFIQLLTTFYLSSLSKT